MTIYDPISKALSLEPFQFDKEYYSFPKDAEHTKWNHESGKAASEALNISKGMVTYLRQKQETGKVPW